METSLSEAAAAEVADEGLPGAYEVEGFLTGVLLMVGLAISMVLEAL